MILYGYWRSSAAYRVRIALNIKGLAYEQVPTDLRRGAHRTLGYLEKNPQGLVPMLEDGEVRISQSVAIIEYLEETHPAPPLLPRDPAGRALVRSLTQLVACEIHPLNNLRVLNHVRRAYDAGEQGVTHWYRHWIAQGFVALETEMRGTAGRYAVGDVVTMADAFLVPQMANARRYGCSLEAYPTLRRVTAALEELAAFEMARPERQPDAA